MQTEYIHHKLILIIKLEKKKKKYKQKNSEQKIVIFRHNLVNNCLTMTGISYPQIINCHKLIGFSV